MQDAILRHHELLTHGLITDAGMFRPMDVEVVKAEGDVSHTGRRHQIMNFVSQNRALMARRPPRDSIQRRQVEIWARLRTHITISVDRRPRDKQL